MTDVGEPNVSYRYKFSIRMSHPTIDPELITAEFNLEPRSEWRAGEPRRTPKGTLLEGTRTFSYWHRIERTVGKKGFFAGLIELVETMFEPHSAFLEKFIASEGVVTVMVYLPGDINMGDELTPQQLMRIARLGIELGVEVFPNMR